MSSCILGTKPGGNGECTPCITTVSPTYDPIHNSWSPAKYDLNEQKNEPTCRICNYTVGEQPIFSWQRYLGWCGCNLPNEIKVYPWFDFTSMSPFDMTTKRQNECVTEEPCPPGQTPPCFVPISHPAPQPLIETGAIIFSSVVGGLVLIGSIYYRKPLVKVVKRYFRDINRDLDRIARWQRETGSTSTTSPLYTRRLARLRNRYPNGFDLGPMLRRLTFSF